MQRRHDSSAGSQLHVDLMAKRGRNVGDASATDAARPEWLNDIVPGTIAILTLADGERVTADILRFDDRSDEIIVDVVASNRHHPRRARRGCAIPVRRVASVEFRPRAERPWPHHDRCRGAPFSVARFAVLATLSLCTFGSVPLFLAWTDKPYGLQVASAFAYTFAVAFFTFSATGWKYGNLPPYMLTCPAVQTQFSRLLWRHLAFLIALFALQTGALAVRPYLPEWWNSNNRGTRGDPPFVIALMVLGVALGEIEIDTNRRLLDRAHREFSS